MAATWTPHVSISIKVRDFFFLPHSLRTVSVVHLSPHTNCSVEYSYGIKRPGREASHLTPTVVEVKDTCRYAAIPPCFFHGVVLKRCRENICFNFKKIYNSY